MKLLLNQTRATIRKSLGVIRKSLSFGEILDNKVLVGTHHKTGTVWMLTIFSAVASYYDLKFCRDKNKAYLRGSSGNFDIFLEDHSKFDFDKLSDYKGLHIIRDPRDVIVSACFYHTKSSEKWLHIKRKDFGGLTYQEKINSYSSFDDKLIFEMENAARNVIEDMRSWNYDNPYFIEIKYEDLIQDTNLILFREIFQFIGFKSKIIPSLLRIAYRKSLFSGQVSNNKHIRSGKKQQWKEYFNSIHEAKFFDLFDDVLLRLNYE